MGKSETAWAGSTACAHEVAMLCKGDDGYGVASVLKQYAENVPELHFVCLGRGAMYEWLTNNGNHVHLVEGLAAFTATSSLSTLVRFPLAMVQARRNAKQLHQLFKRLGIKLVHAHLLPQYLIAGHLRRMGYPTVWHIHGNMNPDRMFGLGVKLNHCLARWGADLIIPVSDFTASNWRGAGVPIRVIHPVVPVIYEQVNEPAEHPIRCIIAGRLTEDKGHHLAIQAVLSARSQGYDVRLDIFGGPLESNAYFDRLEEMVRQGNHQEYIRFLGFSTELRQRHQSYNLGLQCRISPEPFGVWVCETLLDGLPLIAADLGGPTELIENGVSGLLFQSGNVKDLTVKLIELVQDPSRLKSMRHQAYKRGRQLFRSDRFISQNCAAYEMLLRGTVVIGP